MKPMGIEQILRLTLRWKEDQAPPPPKAEWFRQQLAAQAAYLGSNEQSWRTWRQSVWALLEKLRPEPLVPAAAKAKSVVARRPTLGTIPALALREGEEIVTAIEVTQKPMVNPDGGLVLGVRATEERFLEGEAFELVMIAGPDGEMVGQHLSLSTGEEELLMIELPAPLQKAWHGIEHFEWSEIPFRFVLRPVQGSGTDEHRKGEAAGGVGRKRWRKDAPDPGHTTNLVHPILGVCRARDSRRQTSV